MPARRDASAPFAILTTTLMAGGIAQAESGHRAVPPGNSIPVLVPGTQDASFSPTLLAHTDHRDQQPSILGLTVLDRVGPRHIAYDRPVGDDDGFQPGPGGEPRGSRYREDFTTNICLGRKSVKGVS
jgi:hypothetical protein